jgi:hypothetical protein
MVMRGVQIEVLEVHGGKPGITLGENTVDKQFVKFNRARGGSYISGIRDVVSANGDACVVGIVSLLWSDLANNLRVDVFSAAIGWDLAVGNGKEGVGAFDAFAFIGTGANALAKAPQSICIGGVPGSGEGGVVMQLAPFEEVAHVFIKD